jgi:hypothetical protein
MTDKSSVQGQPQPPAESQAAIPAPSAPHICPECLSAFASRHPGQLFCKPAHRDQWNNRAAVRGRVLTPLAIVTRATRGGSRGDKQVGRWARRDHDQLVQRWIVEDRAAGRMDWPAYLRLRYRLGYEPLG